MCAKKIRPIFINGRIVKRNNIITQEPYQTGHKIQITAEKFDQLDKEFEKMLEEKYGLLSEKK